MEHVHNLELPSWGMAKNPIDSTGQEGVDRKQCQKWQKGLANLIQLGSSVSSPTTTIRVRFETFVAQSSNPDNHSRRYHGGRDDRIQRLPGSSAQGSGGQEEPVWRGRSVLGLAMAGQLYVVPDHLWQQDVSGISHVWLSAAGGVCFLEWLQRSCQLDVNAER